MSDAQERTEKATDKRMKDVRSKGKLQKSQDVTAWLGVGAAGVLIPATIAAGTTAVTHQLFTVGAVASHPEPGIAMDALYDGLGSIGPIMGGMLAAVAIAVLAGSVAQGGVHIKTKLLRFDQFDMLAGIKRTFGTQALWQGAKSLLKTGVIGGVLYIVIQTLMPVLMTSGGLSVAAVVEAGTSGAWSLLIAAVAAGLALAAVDVFVVMRKNSKQTKMTKKEVTDENKNSDGDPLVKSQRRSRQLQMSRSRMMSSVADADVVLINPTEFAVALRYEPGKSAPRVVAKGKGVIAARIREEAEKHAVPMVKDIPLTRALHAACELGHEIPVPFYSAIATVLTFVAALKARGSARGVHTLARPVVIPEPAPARGSSASSTTASPTTASPTTGGSHREP
ncbi:EscU/YscU/HrcU family type III secretion system export apparatus switch protein [Glaciihabitans sp. dw_435]|uniref:EscU/YscU/HrcU family type III secretion system export apparatus switch protein n=1 Tax=Glaciihabitans sp. dw_435 TaxID=2720081 RepID=UPI001BD4C551|nr:EscU/YscU/HrcU family type III secretion system export apparatus switch protein [Glaciihabitans sp. dw_435]